MPTRAPPRHMLLAVLLVLCACAASSPTVAHGDEAGGVVEACEADRCVVFACAGDTAECGLYGCEDVLAEEAVGTERTEPPDVLLASSPGGFARAPFLPRHLRNRRLGLRGSAEFQPFFTAAGIDIHAFTMPIPQHIHLRIHGGGPSGGQWNQAWRSFVQARLGRRTTATEIHKHAGELIYRFELMGRIEPYYSR